MVDLFKNSSMACITVNIMFQWFVNTMTYYGLLFGAGELPGSGIRFKFIAYQKSFLIKIYTVQVSHGRSDRTNFGN